MRTNLKPIAFRRSLRRLLKFLGLSGLCACLFVLNGRLLWQCSEFVLRTGVEEGSLSPIFRVVAMVDGKAELFLSKDDLDNYLRLHETYSFLIPDGPFPVA